MESFAIVALAAIVAFLLHAWLFAGKVVEEATKTCEFCRFYDNMACRRYPPGRVYTGDTSKNPEALDVTVWPVVKVDNWCGEHQRKP